MLFLSAEPANSWIVGKQEVGPTGNAARCPPTGDSVALSVTSSSNYCTQWYTSVFQNVFGEPRETQILRGFLSIAQRFGEAQGNARHLAGHLAARPISVYCL